MTYREALTRLGAIAAFLDRADDDVAPTNRNLRRVAADLRAILDTLEDPTK